MGGKGSRWDPSQSTIGSWFEQAGEQGNNNWNDIKDKANAHIDWNPQHSTPGQALQRTGNAAVNLGRGDFNAAGRDLAESGSDWGKTILGAAALASGLGALGMPSALGASSLASGLGSVGVPAALAGGIGSVAAPALGIASGLAAAGTAQNESQRNDPQQQIEKEAADAEQLKQEADAKKQAEELASQQAHQQAEQKTLTQQNQEAFSSQNNLENALRNAYFERRGKRTNANSF